MVITGATPNCIHIEILSDPATLCPARKAIESFATRMGFDHDSWCEIGLVVNEVLANVIRHAYNGKTDQPIHIDARFADDAIVVSIRDWGNGVDPSKLPCRKPDPRCPGGLGMVCLKEMMDKFEFKPQPVGMLLIMTRGRRRSPATPSVA
jgi:serine/threonine-protein kinase RsbW